MNYDEARAEFKRLCDEFERDPLGCAWRRLLDEEPQVLIVSPAQYRAMLPWRRPSRADGSTP